MVKRRLQLESTSARSVEASQRASVREQYVLGLRTLPGVRWADLSKAEAREVAVDMPEQFMASE